MRSARCHRSLKRDEEITLWRSLCALGAPLYGNLCISFPLSFFSLLSLSLLPSRLPATRVHSLRPRPPRTRASFYRLPPFLFTFLAALSSASLSSFIVRVLFLACSTKRTRHSISPIPSFFPRPFPCFSSLSSCPAYSFSSSYSSSFLFAISCLLLVFTDCSRAPLPLPLFSLLVCFPLPAGNCTLSLLPARRFPLICRCSPIRFRVFCLSPSLPPYPLQRACPSAPIYSAFCSRSSFLPSRPDFSSSSSPARSGKKATRVASACLGPGFEFNYSSPHYTRKGRKLRKYNYFLRRELFSFLFVDDLIR